MFTIHIAMKLLEFLHEFGDESTIVIRLRDAGLLRCQLECAGCGQFMHERKTNKRDGFMFECSMASCRKAKSLRTGSFFEHVRLTLCDSMLLLHLWSKGYPEKLICDDYPFSHRTVIDWFRFCRELCVASVETNQNMIGGLGSVVEIDETHIVRRKNNRGRILEEAGWLVGGIERRVDGLFRAFFVIVYNRSGPHLKHLIQQRVVQGTHIITDGWAGYSGLADIGYQHSVVIHDENFVSPEDHNVHTQKIESTWGSLKRFLRAHGTNKGPFLAEYICEYIFRRMFDDVFDELLNVIRREYVF